MRRTRGKVGARPVSANGAKVFTPRMHTAAPSGHGTRNALMGLGAVAGVAGLGYGAHKIHQSHQRHAQAFDQSRGYHGH